MFAATPSPQELYRRLTALFYTSPQMSDASPSYMLDRSSGPMLYLGGQIVKRLGKAGWPAYIVEGYRSPERQRELKSNGKGVTNASAWESAHQFYEAVDIVHKSLLWEAPPEFWETMAAIVRTVADEYDVELVHGHHWKMVDSAHVELKSWGDVRSKQIARAGFAYTPTENELRERFAEILPKLVL